MNYDSVTGLPLKESFLSFVKQFLKREESDRFAFLAINLGPRNQNSEIAYGPQRNFLLSGIVHKFIRKQDYILSAYRHEADTFVAFIDTSLILQSTLEDSLLNAFQSYMNYVLDVFPSNEIKLKGGVYLYQDNESPETAIQNALTTLHMLTTENPTQKILFYDKVMNNFQNIEREVLPLFEDVWSNNHIFIHLQPKVDINSLKVVGAEALVRVSNKSGKTLKPALFLPILEKYNLTYELDLMVAERILILIQKWMKEGISPYPISINLSEDALCSEHFKEVFYALINKYQTAFHYLDIELRHNNLSPDHEGILNTLQELRHLGCRFFMDDVHEIPMKHHIQSGMIDGVICNRLTLLNAIRDEEVSNHLTELVKMYEAYNIPVICKGIETKEEEDFARMCNIQIVQGFYYGRPIPFDIFQKKYLNHIFVI